ncbi:hypothetical protein Cni_G01824 [Canna indica]|uniref:Uncharacterized protein n=1 Tax=Canna indica TaxID=4628 RepID=A0AAQ3JR09_9LILI|nr:hypothetical protein Cni_G01824 [Canna indica]
MQQPWRTRCLILGTRGRRTTTKKSQGIKAAAAEEGSLDSDKRVFPVRLGKFKGLGDGNGDDDDDEGGGVAIAIRRASTTISRRMLP